MRAVRGFSLIELVMVMVLISILAAYASTRFNPDDFEREALAGELLTALRYAQEMSMTHTGGGGANDYQVVVNANGFTLQLEDGTAVPDPYGGASYTANWPDASLTPTTVTFSSDGAPTWSGTIGVTLGAVTTNVVVEAITGYVHLQ